MFNLQDFRDWTEARKQEEIRDREKHPVVWFFKDLIEPTIWYLVFILIIATLTLSMIGFYYLFLL